MATVRDVMARKNPEVVSVAMDCTVLDASRLMMQGRIGGVLVLDGDAQVVGIFTERDVLGRVVAEQRDPVLTKVSEVMTPKPLTVTSLTTLEACGNLMTQRRVRHLPVMDDGELRGMITPGDLLAFRMAEQETLIQDLHSYVFDIR
ncbi:MAG: CBS domain-containing protein [Gemmatimonadaceae bacterium]|nr:CBS domain-containing protein [Gemmatimonadaceae bacterium]